MLRRSAARSLEAALRDLESERPDARESAVADLTRYAGEHRDEVLTALNQMLGDEYAEVRAAALVAIADIDGTELIEATIACTSDVHSLVRQMALSTLGELRDERALPVLKEALSSDTPSDRFQAVMGFARTSGSPERVRQVLLDATRDDDHLVRHIALRIAEERGDDDTPVEAAIAERARALLDDDSDIVRVAAAVILARSGRRDGDEILCAVAGRDIITTEFDDEAAAIELCGELGLKKATPALLKRAFGRIILLTRDPFAWHARVALAALEHPRAVKWVLDELKAWTRERRTLAVAAAGRARLPAAKALLEAMVGDDERADQHALEEALARYASA